MGETTKQSSDEGGLSHTQQNEKMRFEQFKAWHDEAYMYINQAITQEKPNIDRKDVALMMYQRGLGILDLALCVDTSGCGPAWEKARVMQDKMVITRQHIQDRIKELTDMLAPVCSSVHPPPSTELLPCYDSPPCYAESQALVDSVSTDSVSRHTHTVTMLPFSTHPGMEEEEEEVSVVGMRRSVTTDSMTEQGEVLFSIEGVQIFRVSVTGEVTTPSNPQNLYLIKFTRNDNRGGVPAFLEVGQWTYPLLKGSSPALRSEFNNCYMFPDLDTGIEGGAVGVLVPNTVTQTEREIFESLLAELTETFKTKEDVEAEYQEYRQFSNNLASGLVRGSEILGKGMVSGAVKGSQLMFHGADYIKQRITPEDGARSVDPRVKQGLEAAAWVSSGACRVSGWMVSKVGMATMALGRLVAPHLERGANRALTHVTGQSNHESSNQLAIVGEVASGTVAAISTMYIALENSSKILAKNIANNTVMIVSHKYGTEVAAVTNSALSTAGNSYLTFYNTAALGPKGIAKRAAKDTGKAFIGVDQQHVNARARLVPDQDLNIKDVLPGGAGEEKDIERKH